MGAHACVHMSTFFSVCRSCKVPWGHHIFWEMVLPLILFYHDLFLSVLFLPQNMVQLISGFALSGFKPFSYTFDVGE